MTDPDPAPQPSALHHDALRLLRDWRAPDAVQEQVRRAYVAHLEAEPAGLQRECYPDHITASTLIMSADHTKVLLTLHAKAEAWFQMGGHCEPGDTTLPGAAMREAVEESGIENLELDPIPVQLNSHDVPFCDPRGGVHHLDVRFLALAPEDASHTVSGESLDVRWWPANGLPSDEPNLLELVDLAGRRLSG